MFEVNDVITNVYIISLMIVWTVDADIQSSISQKLDKLEKNKFSYEITFFPVDSKYVLIICVSLCIKKIFQIKRK